MNWDFLESRRGFLSALRAVWDLVFFAVVTLGFLLFLLPFVIFRIRSVVQWTAKLWARALAGGLGLKIRIENPRNLVREGPLIFLVNHQSYLDIITLLVALDRNIAWMAKASLFKIPLFGWAMSASGAIAVERGKAAKARASLYKAARQIQNGSPVLIFPEGTRGHPDGSMLPLKTGGFVLAKLAKVPLQPVTIYGPNEVLPIKQPYRIVRIFRKRTIRVCIHKPIFPDEYESLGAAELAARVSRILKRPIERYRSFNEILDA